MCGSSVKKVGGEVLLKKCNGKRVSLTLKCCKVSVHFMHIS